MDASETPQAAHARRLEDAGRRLADVRAVLEEALGDEAPEGLVNLYTGALMDAIREWQWPMWGPDYIDPTDGPRRDAESGERSA